MKLNKWFPLVIIPVVTATTFMVNLHHNGGEFNLRGFGLLLGAGAAACIWSLMTAYASPGEGNGSVDPRLIRWLGAVVVIGLPIAAVFKFGLGDPQTPGGFIIGAVLLLTVGVVSAWRVLSSKH